MNTASPLHQCSRPIASLKPRYSRMTCSNPVGISDRYSRPVSFPKNHAAPPTASQQGTSSQGPYSDLSDTLSLSNIRQTLILMEDTIIFALIERAQYAHNEAVYVPDAVPIPCYNQDGSRLSLLEYMLRETEQVHGRIRRYTSPEENAYFPEALPPLVLPPISFEQVLAPCASQININSKILDTYIKNLLPQITRPGDDRNYGSAAMYDVMILQALSRRIHYGKFVAEAKFREYTAEYTELIKNRNAQGILDKLTDRAVEIKVIERVKLKAATFGQDLSAANTSSSGNNSVNHKVAPEVVAQMYDDWVMPLTKEVEVDYLLQRLES